MEEVFADVSWTAVIVGAVVSFLVGWLWYSPLLFGPKWAAGVGVEMNTADKMPFGAMGMQGLGLLLMSWFVGVTAKTDALLTVILATLAFAALGISGSLFERNSGASALINAGYWIVALVLMILCQGLFRGLAA